MRSLKIESTSFLAGTITNRYGKDKEDVLEGFKAGGNILIATTLVEVGGTYPECVGLSLTTPIAWTGESKWSKRLLLSFHQRPQQFTLEAFCETIDGFEIAELDLQFRQGGGDLLKGDVQSGKHFKWFDP